MPQGHFSKSSLYTHDFPVAIFSACNVTLHRCGLAPLDGHWGPHSGGASLSTVCVAWGGAVGMHWRPAWAHRSPHPPRRGVVRWRESAIG